MLRDNCLPVHGVFPKLFIVFIINDEIEIIEINEKKAIYFRFV